MASTSYSRTPAADPRRLRATQLSFQTPSFSLGIDSETFGFDEFHECAEPFGVNRVEEGEEVSGWRFLEKSSDGGTDKGVWGAEDCFASEIDGTRQLKRLKKVSSLRNQSPQKTPGSQAGPNKLTSSISSPSSAPQKRRLPVKDTTKIQLQDFCAAHLKSFGGGNESVKEGDKEAVFSSGSQPMRRLSLFVPGASPDSSVEKSQRTAKGDCNISKDGISSQRESRHTKNDGGRNGGAEEVDDIEELSDGDFFGSGSRLQRDQSRLSTPQKSGPNNPVSISSSPEGSQKPVLHIPGAAGVRRKENKMLLKLSQTPVAAGTPVGKVDPISRGLDDFECGSGGSRKGLYDLDRPSQTFQRDNATTSGGRVKPPFSVGKSPHVANQSGLSRDGTIKSFFTKTPIRADTVGPSRAVGRDNEESRKRDDERRKRDEQRVQACLRQRFPHFKPIDALLVDGGFGNEPVYIDYRNQFADGTRCRAEAVAPAASGGGSGRRTWPAVRSIKGAFSASTSTSNKSSNKRRANGNKKTPVRSQPNKRRPKKASSSSATRNAGVRKGGGSGKPANGKWSTVNGTRVFSVGGNRMSGYSTYVKGRGGTSSKKRSKLPPKKSKYVDSFPLTRK